MPELSELKMIELVEKFKEDVINIQESRSAKLFKQASADLQKIYNYHLSNDKMCCTVIIATLKNKKRK